MLCDRCKKREATVYYTEIIDGKKKEQHLCEECASEYTKFQMKSSLQNKEITLGSVLSNILTNYYNEQQKGKEEKKESIKCPECGMTYDTFVLDGKFGCAICYKTFGKLLDKNFRQVQGACNHVGKKPKGFLSETDRIINGLSDVERLTIQLQDAIEKEEFEKAAKLRDRIRELRREEDGKVERKYKNGKDATC